MTPNGGGHRIRIQSSLVVGEPGAAGVGTDVRRHIGLGDSIACNGVCLTVEDVRPPNVFVVTAGSETLACSTIGALRAGDRLHLERALRLGDRLDGHLVSGHVDGVARVVSRKRMAESTILWLEFPPELSRFIAPKGSLCLDGVSLTVNEVGGARARVNVIPHTEAQTLLGARSEGSAVNIEVDLLARYVERLMVGTDKRHQLDATRMRSLGYGR